MKYDWIFFDLDNTLLDFDRSAHQALEKTFQEYHLPFTPSNIDLYHQINRQCWEAFEAQRMDAVSLRSERFRLFLEAINVSGPAPQMGQRYLHHLAHSPYLLDGAQDLLNRLRGKHQLVVVTNGLKEVQRTRLELCQLTPFFSSIIVSDEIGVSKPHAPFFDFAFQSIGHPPKERVLMVGDSLSSDIKGGYQYGLATCWFNPQGKANASAIQPSYELDHLDRFESVILS